MKFILIAVFVSSSPSFPGVSFQEFDSKEACIGAQHTIVDLENKMRLQSSYLHMECVPKDATAKDKK
jgi:hypothetical protein